MKVFSGSEILALALKEKIEAIGIDVLMKDNIQSARLAGFGSSGKSQRKGRACYPCFWTTNSSND